VKRSRGPQQRPSPPPPLEANDVRVNLVGVAGWAVALIVLLIVRDRIPADARWWLWTCVTGLALGLFALWYVPRFKRGRARAAARRARDQSAPRDNGSNTVSSTDTPGKSTMS
jgi:hypothetical protein